MKYSVYKDSLNDLSPNKKTDNLNDSILEILKKHSTSIQEKPMHLKSRNSMNEASISFNERLIRQEQKKISLADPNIDLQTIEQKPMKKQQITRFKVEMQHVLNGSTRDNNSQSLSPLKKDSRFTTDRGSADSPLRSIGINIINSIKKGVLKNFTKGLLETERKKKEQSKIFEQKKMLKTRVYKAIYKVFYQPDCSIHSRHQQDFQMKIDFANNRPKIGAMANSRQNSQKSLTERNHNSISHHKLKPLLLCSHDDPPNINEVLMKEFTEEELQEMFEDLRFYFSDEKIYKKLEIFHILDIFNGDHFRIKENYIRYKQQMKQNERDKKNEEEKFEKMTRELSENFDKVDLSKQPLQIQKTDIQEEFVLQHQKHEDRDFELDEELLDIEEEIRQHELQESKMKQEEQNNGKQKNQVKLLDKNEIMRMPKLSIDQYRNFQKYRASSQSHKQLPLVKARSLSRFNANSLASKEEKLQNLEKQIRFQQKLKQVELNKIQNLFSQISCTYQSNQITQLKQNQLSQMKGQNEAQMKIVGRYLPELEDNFKKQQKQQMLRQTKNSGNTTQYQNQLKQDKKGSQSHSRNYRRARSMDKRVVHFQTQHDNDYQSKDNRMQVPFS